MFNNSNIKTKTQVTAEKLEVAKQSAIAQINSERDTAIASGVDYDGHTYQSDSQSIADLGAITTLSTLNSAIIVPWLTSGNATVNLTATDIQTLAGLFATHKTTHVIAARTKKDAVLAATTITQINTILAGE